MINESEIVIEESNVISLRTVWVIDNKEYVTFSLDPALEPAPTKNIYKVEYGKWLDSCFIRLYRHMKSVETENEIQKDLYSVGRNIRPLKFGKPPQIKLQWSDSGNSVALFLNEEPWAFFEEETKKGYTKGILNSSAGNLWCQGLFEKTFLGQ